MRSLRIKGLAAIAAAVATVSALALSDLPASARSNDASQVAAALDKIAATGRIANVIPSQTDAGFAALTAVASIPFDPMAGVTIKTSNSQKITIGLPDAGHLSKGIKTASGVVIYRNSNGSDAVAVPTAQGVQFLTVIENSNAPTNYTYPTTTPQGGKIQLTADGGALVLDNHGVPVSSVAAPWALGGNNTVKTWFSTDGRTLTQHVAHKASEVRYPIVADPYVSYSPIYWSGYKIGDRFILYLDRFETSNVAGMGAGVASALLARAGIPTWVAPILGGVARDAAYRSGQCATLQYDVYWGWAPSVSTWVRSC